MKITYYSQWASHQRAKEILDKSMPLTQDPLWKESGADSIEEYAKWANHICGMACLKMVLAAYTGKVHSLFDLTKMAIEYQAYQEIDGMIKGMIYAPFVHMLAQEFGIQSKVVIGVATKEIHGLLNDGNLLIASVNPSIRNPEVLPEKKGGHLVLISKATAKDITFHNPSGDSDENKSNVNLSTSLFDHFYAERGILINSR